jgi:predicted ATPase
MLTMLTLNHLPRRRGAERILYVTGGKVLPKEIADQIVDRTDGVPLFIERRTMGNRGKFPGAVLGF